MNRVLVTELSQVDAGFLIYPAGHKVGMRVPLNGSDCAKCSFVRADGKECANGNWQAWAGTNVLPFPADRYCCDFFAERGELDELLR